MLDRLRQLGWSHEELVHLQQHFIPRKESRILVACMLVLLAIAAVGVPYGYLFLMATMPAALVHLVLVVVGFPLGAAFGLLLVDLDRLDRVHHIVLLIALPIGVIATCMVLFKQILLLASSQNALIGGLLYAFAFITPYAFLVNQEWNSRIGQSHL